MFLSLLLCLEALFTFFFHIGLLCFHFTVYLVPTLCVRVCLCACVLVLVLSTSAWLLAWHAFHSASCRVPTREATPASNTSSTAASLHLLASDSLPYCLLSLPSHSPSLPSLPVRIAETWFDFSLSFPNFFFCIVSENYFQLASNNNGEGGRFS